MVGKIERTFLEEERVSETDRLLVTDNMSCHHITSHHIRASTQSELVAQASDTAIHLHLHDGIGYRVTAATEPKEH